MRSKLLLLAAPFLKRWNYARHAEQISGGHKYLPPRQDVNAPGEEGGCYLELQRRNTATACSSRVSACMRGSACLHCLSALLVRAAAKAAYTKAALCLPTLPQADLYIPDMALWTYCLLLGVAALARSGPNGGFKPETIYNSVGGTPCSRCLRCPGG